MGARLEYDLKLFKKEHPNKKDHGIVDFENENEAKAAADFIYKMGGWAMVLSGYFEYYPWVGQWEIM